MAFTPVFGTGFEYGTSPFVPGVTGNVEVVATQKHTGSYSAKLSDSSHYMIYKINGTGVSNEIDMGLWNYKTSSISDIHIYFYLTDGSYIDIRLPKIGDYMTVRVNSSTPVATGIWSMPSARWANIQIRLLVSNTGYVKVRFDGNNDIDYSGDTKVGSVDQIDYIKVTHPSNAQTEYVDDIVIGYGGWSGDVRFDGLFPDGDTATRDWLKTGFSLNPAPAAPTVAVGASPGLTGDYYYKVTFVDTDGETVASAASAMVQPSNQSVDLSDIDIGPDGTTARKIYRTAAGGSTYKLVTTINDNTTTTYNDTVADGSLGATLPANSPHYTEIDERPANTADFIWSDIDGAQDLFTVQAWDATKKQPVMVVNWAYCKKVTADNQQLKFLLKSGATLKTSGAYDALTSESMLWNVDVLDPDGSPWTDEVIDDLEIGVELVGSS